MKLKKIASLMLAGVMAVSMLAGCKGSANSGEGNGEENQVVAASVADYANSLMSGAQKNVFEFKNSADLTAALQKVASDSTKFTSKEIGDVYDTVLMGINKTQADQDIKDALKKELDLDEMGASTMTPSKEGTKTAGWAYQISGKATEASAVQLVVKNFVDETMDSTTNYFPAVSGNFKCDYTAEISAVKVSAPDNGEKSAWVVAIVVTQTAANISNAA